MLCNLNKTNLLMECVNRRGGRRNEIKIVFGVVNGLIRAPFDVKAAVLQKGLAFVESDEGLNASNGGVG